MKKSHSILLILLCSLFSFSFSTTMKERINEWKTEEGARVLFINAPEIPMVDIIVGMDAGSIREGTKYGLSSLTANMMTLGTQDKDETEFSEALENLGSSISARASTGSTLFSLRSITDKAVLEPTLALFSEMIQSPRFDESIFNRERTQIIDAQKAKLDSPSAIANETFYTTLYPNSPKGVTTDEMKASLLKLTIEDLKAFRDSHYNATDANIIIVGDLSLEEAKKISNQISHLLGKGPSYPKYIDSVESVSPSKQSVFFPSPQSQILIGHDSIDRNNEDFLTLTLGNHVLGGSGLTSLLMMDIREKQGLTYGISSGFNAGLLHGPFIIGLATKNESVEKAIQAAIKGVEDFIQNGPTDEDLARAKNNLVGSAILSLSSNSSLANALYNIAQFDLPLDYYDTYPDKIKAISKEEIQKAFKKHVHPENFTTVIVGGEQPK